MKKVLFTLALGSLAAASQAVIWGFSVPIMSGAQEVPPNNTTAYGTASFTVNDQNWNVAGSVNVWGIAPTVVTGMHIHQGAFGTNGPVRFDILANQVPGSPFNAGTFRIYAFNGTLNLGSPANNTAFLNTMIAGNAYINLHTQQFPGGQIRGQIECNGVVPEPATLAALGAGAAFLIRRRRK